MACFSDAEAIEIWIARWNKTKVQDLIAKYKKNTFRFYEVWKEEVNPGTRLKAFEQLKRENPKLASQTNPKPHIPTRKVVPNNLFDSKQLSLF